MHFHAAGERLFKRPDSPCSAVQRHGPQRTRVQRTEIDLLEHVVHDTSHNAHAPPLARNVIRLAQLGGYLARVSDPPQGNTVMWRGMRRVTDIPIGYELALKEVGNCKRDETFTILPNINAHLTSVTYVLT